MSPREIHQCQCEICQDYEVHPIKEKHHRMNVLMSRLDEQQRRWYAGMEAENIGHGGSKQISNITGLNVNTIRRGRREIANGLLYRPPDRIRQPGGGRKAVEKKVLSSNKP